MATFGNVSSGTALENIAGTCVGIRKADFLYEAGPGETVTRVYVYGVRYEQGGVNVDVGLYTVDGSGNLDDRVAVTSLALPLEPGDWASNDVEWPLEEGVTYALALGEQSQYWGGVGRSIGDSGDGCYLEQQSLPDPFGQATETNYRWSVFAEYEAAPTGGPFPHYVRRRLEGGMIDMG